MSDCHFGVSPVNYPDPDPLWHYVCEHIIYTLFSYYVLVFAFAFLSAKKKSALNFSPLNHTVTGENLSTF